MSSQAIAASKPHGVICIHSGCFRFLQTTKFKQHYEGHHQKEGESYISRHRDDYERSLLDPNLLGFGDDGPLKAVFVASLVRIAHSLDTVASRLDALESRVASTPTAASNTPLPSPPDSADPPPPASSPPAPAATPSTPASTVADQVAEADEEDPPVPPKLKAKRAQTKAKAGASKTRKTTKKS